MRKYIRIGFVAVILYATLETIASVTHSNIAELIADCIPGATVVTIAVMAYRSDKPVEPEVKKESV